MSWLCARTHVNCEKIAIQNLQRQDFDYYQPLIQEKKIRKQKLQVVEQPLFPCYLFVRVDQQYRSLNYTYGIASLVNGIVHNSIIESLRQREQNGFIQLPKPAKFEIGDKVEIQKGAFTGQQALVEGMRGKDRQNMLLSLLSGAIEALVNEDDLIAA